MKRLLFGIYLLAMPISNSFAQETYSEIGTQTEYITEVKSQKTSLFLNAQTWANTNTTERGVNIETTDKESGTLILKVTSKLPTESGINSYTIIKVQMNVKIDCRDNKYRIRYSNFTSTVQPDRTINTEYLSTSSLEKMINELEVVEKLASTSFDNEIFWGYDKIISAINKYSDENKNYENEIASFDAESKKGKKEIKWRNSWIADNNSYINYLKYILKGFGTTIKNVQESLSTAMNVSDDF